MQGVSPGSSKGGQGGGKAPMSVEQINKMVAGIGGLGEGDDDLSDLSDLDEEELLGELQVCVCMCVRVFRCVCVWFMVKLNTSPACDDLCVCLLY